MAPGKLTLHMDVDVKEILCTAIREYARAAYPEGGSDCAQVARYTLLQLAQQIDAGITPQLQRVEISRRPRAMIKAAIEYHFDREDTASGGCSVRQRTLLNGLLQGEAVTRDGLEQARGDDAAG